MGVCSGGMANGRIDGMRPLSNILWFVVAFLSAASPTFSDTIHLRGGIPIDGVVEVKIGDVYTVRTGNRKIMLQEEEIVTVEKNDRDGSLDLEAIKEEARRHDEELVNLTGLNAAQRMEVDMALEMLYSDNEEMSNDGRRRLLAMREKVDIYPYMAHIFPDMHPANMAKALLLMFELDPEKVRPLLSERATHPEENLRAACVRLLGKVPSPTPSELELMVRGLADHQETVRAAASNGLVSAPCREATPMLIRVMQAGNPVVDFPAKAALGAAWSIPGQTVSHDNWKDWLAFWQEHAAQVPLAYDPERIVPLVEPGVTFQNE